MKNSNDTRNNPNSIANAITDSFANNGFVRFNVSLMKVYFWGGVIVMGVLGLFLRLVSVF